MPVTDGQVVRLSLSRRLAKVTVRHTSIVLNFPLSADHYFVIYHDGPGSVTIDPTEMVKRNWLISLLELALRDHLKVAVSHDDETVAVVRGVTVYGA